MEFLMDPQIWVGLLTLVVLEIVLGIDNLCLLLSLPINFRLNNEIKHA
jgi:predicted tellurium resistance membrane protein TerC